MPRDVLLDMYLRDIGCFPVFTKAQEQAVARRVRSGDQAARHEMIQCNLRLVVSVARHYEGQGMPILDVVEEGNIGLMRAVERFNPDLGCRF
jgi:DNA-directed RNA polymerase sigma subunit (sigma70/sigma32)